MAQTIVFSMSGTECPTRDRFARLLTENPHSSAVVLGTSPSCPPHTPLLTVVFRFPQDRSVVLLVYCPLVWLTCGVRA